MVTTRETLEEHDKCAPSLFTVGCSVPPSHVLKQGGFVCPPGATNCTRSLAAANDSTTSSNIVIDDTLSTQLYGYV